MHERRVHVARLPVLVAYILPVEREQNERTNEHDGRFNDSM